MITLIFGAGASFGSGGCLPTNPPLGADLFSELQKLGGAFTRLDNRQQRVFLEQGFEPGMATIANDSREINPLQKELACYLAGFTAQRDNAYSRLFSKLKTFSNRIAIATLNYDLLIEHSLSHHRISFDYNNQGEGVPLMKIHGSSNFLPELGNLHLSGNVMVNCGTFVEGLNTNAVSSAEEVKSWCDDPRNSDISPILAMYQKGKRVVVNTQLIEKIQKDYADAVTRSSHLVIVGTKYVEHDQHVWKPIAESSASILLVDPYPEATVNWARAVQREGVRALTIGFDQAVWKIAKFVRAAAA